jgi:PAS domain S-box-containing protein
MGDVSPELLAFAVEHTADAVIMTDTRTRILYVNPAFTRITGFEPDELIGRNPGVMSAGKTSRDYYERIWAVILERGWWRGEFVDRKKSGEEWVASLSISAVRDRTGKVLAYVGIATDVTEVKRLQVRLKQAGLDAITMLAVACEAKDETTGNHVRRIEQYARLLARKLGLSETEAEEVGYSSIMHDLGKLHVPDEILQKPGPLSTAEWVAMRRHPADGRAILRPNAFFELARQIAGGHHERWDGTGYPDGLKGEEIPLGARITAVADVFDALSTRRPYKPPWPTEACLAELRALSGKALDPKAVESFIALVETGEVQAVRERYP